MAFEEIVGEQAHDGGVGLEETAVGRGAVEDLGVEARAGGIHRVAAGHAEGDGLVAGDFAQQIDAAVKGVPRVGEGAFLQERARVREGVDFERETFGEPGLELRGVVGGDEVREDADGGAAVDLLQAIEDRAEEGLVFLRVAHVVDGEDDDGLDARLADPLRRDEFREIAVRVEGIVLVEIREAVGVGGEGRGFGRSGEKIEEREESQGERVHGAETIAAAARFARGFFRSAGAVARETSHNTLTRRGRRRGFTQVSNKGVFGEAGDGEKWVAELGGG